GGRRAASSMACRWAIGSSWLRRSVGWAAARRSGSRSRSLDWGHPLRSILVARCRFLHVELIGGAGDGSVRILMSERPAFSVVLGDVVARWPRGCVALTLHAQRTEP